MNTGEKFSIKYVTYDANRRSGGKIREWPIVRLSTKEERQAASSGTAKKKRNPNHYKHATRSFVVYNGEQSTGGLKKFHIYLLLEVNGKKVVL